MSQFGGGQMAGAFSNIFMEALGGGMKEAINNGPLPQFMKDAANSAVDDVIGNNQQETSPDCQNACEETDFASLLRDAAMQGCRDASEEADEKCEGEGKNWLEVLAGSLADIQNKYMDKVIEAKDKLDAAADKDGDDGQSDFITAQNEYQSMLQMYKQMAEISSTTLKTIGEALSTLARKQ
jgi:hypothetical protein